MGKLLTIITVAMGGLWVVLQIALFVAGLATLPDDWDQFVRQVRAVTGGTSSIADWVVLAVTLFALILSVTWGRWQIAWRAIRDRDRLGELARKADGLSQQLSERAAAYRSASSSRMFDSGDRHAARAEEYRSSSAEVERYVRELIAECADAQDELRDFGILLHSTMNGDQQIEFITVGAVGFDMIEAAKAFKIAARKARRVNKLGWKLAINDQQ